MKKKIGLLGGTFDPIHNGHLIIAEYLRDELKLAEIWFVPAKIHPLKDNRGITKPEYRLEMLRLAISDNKNFKIDDIEIERQNVSYTVDTLKELSERYHSQNPEFYFFIGMDNVNEFYQWKQPEEILERSQVVAFGRPGFTPDESARKYLPSIKFVHVPLLEISSTYIRKRIREKCSVRYLIPEAVEKFIKEKNLYI